MRLLLQAENLFKSYTSEVETTSILADLSLSVEPNSMHCIFGPSGSGKTTLLNCLSGLDTVDLGRVLVGEINLSQANTKQLSLLRKQYFGFVYQSHHLLLNLSVIENIALPELINGSSISDACDKAESLLNRFKLQHLSQQKAYTLSGGERQRVAIARALAINPKIIIADEPTGSLDVENANLVIELLYDYITNQDAACILATHDQSLLQPGCYQHKLIAGNLVTKLIK